MRLGRAAAILLAAIVPLQCGWAFDRCDRFFATPDELRFFIVANAVRDAPMKYYDRAKTIHIETGTGERLFPYALLDANAIVIPAAFPPLLCRMALATFLVQEGHPEPMAEAATAAAHCILSGGARDECIVEYVEDLERRYRAEFAKLAPQYQKNAYSFAENALAELAKHEFAHQLLRHRERIGSGELLQVDAEFEADFYALQNTAQTGGNYVGMYYFFKPLADLESTSKQLIPPEETYESSRCRATNVDDIVGALGIIAPLALLDTVKGGGAFKQSAGLKALANELRRKPAPKPSSESCGRLKPKVLSEAYGELSTLLSLVGDYENSLRWTPGTYAGEKESRTQALSRRAPAEIELIGRLQKTSQSFVWLQGLAVRTLSMLILGLDYAGLEAGIADQLDRIVAISRDEILASDYGRLLEVKGVHIIYDQPGQPLAARMDAAQPLFEESVELLPAAAESWLNLAMIAFARGDCVKAADLGNKAAKTAVLDEQRHMAEQFRDDRRKEAQTGHCEEASKRFATRFGR